MLKAGAQGFARIGAIVALATCQIATAAFGQMPRNTQFDGIARFAGCEYLTDEAAIRQLRQRAAAGQAQAQFCLGHGYANGMVDDPDYRGTSTNLDVIAEHHMQLADQWYGLAARHGTPRMLAYYGDFLRWRNRPDDARAMLDRAARTGDGETLFIMAVMCSNANWCGGRPRTYALFRLSAERGFPQGIAELLSIERRYSPEDRIAGIEEARRIVSPAPRASAAARPATHNPGRDVTRCVRIVQASEPGATLPGQRIENGCGQIVQAFWCRIADECARDFGNTWTLQASGPLASRPIPLGEHRLGACIGRDGGHFVAGSEGRQIICEAGRR